MKELDDLLQHHGVKGMRWGIVNWRKPGGASGQTRNRQNGDKKPGKIKQHLNSMKRERSWKKALKDINKMSTKDIRKVASRAQLENEFKRLSKGKAGSRKDRSEYLRRENMSDQELTRKVGRLRAIDNLTKQVNEASKTQREVGTKIVKAGAILTAQYALNKNITVADVYNSYTNPKQAQAVALQALTKPVTNKVILKKRK